MSAPTAPEPIGTHARGRLPAYAWWQLRDYLINKGIATALISGLMLFLSWSTIRTFAPAGAMLAPEMIQQLIDRLFPEFLDRTVLFGVLFATNGIVSEDRKFGYYRFLFSKPVSVVAFYAQKFVVHIGALLCLIALMMGIHAAVVEPRFPPALLAAIPMVVVGLAGIGFLLSALFTVDWITLLAVYGAALIGWLLYGDDTGVRGVLVRALPPVHELMPAYRAMTVGETVASGPLWWIFLYGVACFFLGLVVISRRKLATN